MYSKDGWEWRIDSPVNFENSGDSKNFHIKFYGGAGYPYNGGVQTKEPADIVVLGDSHGRHYIEGLYKILANPNNLNLYNHSGFSSIRLPMFTRISKGTDFDKLSPLELKKGLLSIKNGIGNPLVIISEDWVYQMKTADLLDNNGKRRNKKIKIDDIINGIYQLKEQIGNSTLVVIGNVPGAKDNLYDIFTRPQPIFFTTFNPNDYIYSKPKEKNLKFNKRLAEAAKDSGKFIFFDPHDVLCKDGLCRNLDKQKHLIYSDTSHLSKYGSIEVINGFLPTLKKLLKERDDEIDK